MKLHISKLLLFSLFICIILTEGCVKDNIITPDGGPTPGPIVKSKATSFFLGHKGAGSNNYNTVNMEHSIASFKEALQYLDGVEIDAQMSKDGTIWLFHDVDINASLCSPTSVHNSILTLHDNQIAALQLCQGTKKDRVYKFSELIDLWNSSPNGFYIDMEIKTAIDKPDYDFFGGEPTYLIKMAASMNNVLSNLKHPGKLLQVDDYSTRFSTAMKTYPVGKTLTYMLVEDLPFATNVADAIKGNFDGVIHIFTDPTLSASAVKAAQAKGLLVSLFSPYTDAEVLGTYNLLPDFIDTDHTTVKKDLNIQ